MAELVKNYVGGVWVEARSGATFDTYNPATEALIAPAALSSADDVDAAVKAAKAAYKEWRLVPAPRRGEVLYAVAELLKERKEALARTMTQEMGKVLSEARGDVQEAIDMAYYMGGEGRRLLGCTRRNARQIRHGDPRFGRRHRFDHPLEFPGCRAQLENASRTGRRQCRRLEAQRGYPENLRRVRQSL
jgi:acyl-CoA reductase-like NAD-dependent aldehyde dehydrogenase